MQILKFSLLFSFLFLMLACEDQEPIVIDDSSGISEPMIGDESIGSIHNRYLEDGMAFFCSRYTGDNEVENTLNTYDYLVQQFVDEYGFDQDQVESVLEESGMGPEDAVNFDPEIYDEIIANSAYDEFWQTFKAEFVAVENADELEVLLQQLYETYQEELEGDAILAINSVARNSYQYWDDNYARWETCGQGVGRGPTADGGKRVVSADVGGAISGAISGGIMGSFAGGVGAVPGAAAGAALGATYGSLFAAISYFIW